MMFVLESNPRTLSLACKAVETKASTDTNTGGTQRVPQPDRLNHVSRKEKEETQTTDASSPEKPAEKPLLVSFKPSVASCYRSLTSGAEDRTLFSRQTSISGQKNLYRLPFCSNTSFCIWSRALFHKMSLRIGIPVPAMFPYHRRIYLSHRLNVSGT